MYLFFDTETNGFPPKARMTQLAFILLDENMNVIQQYSSHVLPDGWTVPKDKFFIDNNMSTERCQAEGIPVYDVLRKFQEALKLCKYKIAHNINFDNKIVSKEIQLAGITHELFQFKKSYCTMLNTTDLVGIKKSHAGGNKWPKLIELHQFLFNKDFKGAHDALDDVKAMVNCFVELKNRKLINI